MIFYPFSGILDQLFDNFFVANDSKCNINGA